MGYPWDSTKAAANRRKHGIRFADAITVFADEQAITIEAEHPEEERCVTIGMDALGRLLVVVYMYRGDETWLISARKAAMMESQQYESNL